jgi:NADPH-dependent curcumin reductase CurA
MLLAMRPRGRIVACGMIGDYNRSDDPHPVTNLWQVVTRELTIQGFMLFSYDVIRPAARTQLAEWVRSGQIVVVEHVTRGFANTPAAYCELMSGKTVGKALVEIDAAQSTSTP